MATIAIVPIGQGFKGVALDGVSITPLDGVAGQLIQENWQNSVALFNAVDSLLASHASQHISTGSDPIPAGTESVRGTIELATQAEVDAGADDARAITPLKLFTAILDKRDFDPAVASPAHTEGRVFYHQDEHALACYNDEANVTQQLGQEEYVRVYNNSGGQIDDGTPVSISGVDGVEFRPTIVKARSDAMVTSRVLGLSTHDIPNGTFGYVTAFGLVNDLDTSAFGDGDSLYLDEATAGALRSTPPPEGNFEVLLGYVIRSHATLGKILVQVNAELGILAGDAREIIIPVLKDSPGTINPGEAVYIAGYNSGQDRSSVELSDANAAATMPVIGIARDTITNSAEGNIVAVGQLIGQNTVAFAAGDELYVSETPGALTNVRPTGTALVQKIGQVGRSHASQGVIEVFGPGHVNELPNLPTDNVWMGDGSAVPVETARAGIDNTAIHDNIASEISAIANKATPVDGDFLVIEDSEAANVKKHILISDLPGDDTLFKASCGDEQGAGIADYTTLEDWIDAFEASDAKHGICYVLDGCELFNARTITRPVSFRPGDIDNGQSPKFELSAPLTLEPDAGSCPYFDVDGVSFNTKSTGQIIVTPSSTNGEATISFRNCAQVRGGATTGIPFIKLYGSFNIVAFENVLNLQTVGADRPFIESTGDFGSQSIYVKGCNTISTALPYNNIDGATLHTVRLYIDTSDFTFGLDFSTSTESLNLELNMDGGSIYPLSLFRGGSSTVTKKIIGGDKLYETGGPTFLDIAAIADTEVLVRSGTDVVGVAPAGIDTDAIHDNIASEISAITDKAVPVDADFLIIEDSEAGNVKKSITIGNLPFSSLPVDFAEASSDTEETTTGSAYPADGDPDAEVQNKVNLTTGSLSGTYEIDFYIELSNSLPDAPVYSRVRDRTGGVTEAGDVQFTGQFGHSVDADEFKQYSGTFRSTFSAESKVFTIQFRRDANEGGTVLARNARIALRKVTV